MPSARQHLTTLEDYETLPEDIRAEVFDGQIQYMSSPSQIHQTILLELSSILNTYVKEKKGPCKVLPAPFDVKLNDRPLIILHPYNPAFLPFNPQKSTILPHPLLL